MTIQFRKIYLSERPLLVLILAAAVAVGVSEIARKPMPPRHIQRQAAGAARPPAVPVPMYFREWRASYLAANAPPEGADRLGLVRGIFLGDDSSVQPGERALFRRAGLTHLLAASGFNCWIVAAAFALVARLALWLATPVLPSRALLAARVAATPLSRLTGAWLFWLWTDQSPPITRSAAMISGMFLLELIDFGAPFGRLLLVQYLCSLTLLPRLWHSASFQLTFGCLFGIVLLPPRLERWRPRGAILAVAWNYAAVSIGACLGTIPTTWIAFGEINFTSVLTNWFAIPPVSFVIMPLGLAQMLILAPGAPWSGWAPARTLAIATGWAAAQAAQLLHWTLHAWMSVVPSLRYYD